MLQNLKNKVHVLKRNSLVLYFAYKDPRLSIWKKLFIALVIGYLFSPIDLIPDFIPIFGYLDDLLLVPLGIYVAVKLIPSEILEQAKLKSLENNINQIPVGYKTSVFIVIFWIIGIVILLLWIGKTFS
jgi:uncharacterized membrane protein YkvA (DUF1232 family)